MKLDNQARLSLLGVVLIALFSFLPLQAVLARPTADPITNPVVNTLADDETDGCAVQNCTLREAITDAASGSLITFDPAVSGVITLTQGQLVIEKDLTITGPEGAGIKISANHASRVLEILSGTVVLNRLTFQDGGSSEAGAGINIEEAAVVTINQSAVIDNVITNSQPGGGIRVAPYGTLTLNNSTVSGNQAGGDASGILGEMRSHIAINYSTITNNHSTNSTSEQAYAGGGGILGGVSLRGSIVAGNIADLYWGPDCYTPNGYGDIQSYGFNYIQDPGGTCTVSPVENPGTDQVGLHLNPLADAGLGTIDTTSSFAPFYPLLPGSPALNRVPPALCSAGTDQLGNTRPQAGLCDTGAVEMLPVGQVPTAEDAAITTKEGAAYSGSIAASDPQGQDLTYSVILPPAHGSLELNGKDYTYTPADRYAGPDQFIVKVADIDGDAAAASVTVTVTPSPIMANPDGTYVFSTFDSSDPRYQWVDLADCPQGEDYCTDFDLTQGLNGYYLPQSYLIFPFHFYNDFYTTARINIQGYIEFNQGSGTFLRLLAGDKVVAPGKTHIYLLLMPNPDTRQVDKAVIEYVDLADAKDPTQLSTFEAILSSDGTIKVLYQKVNGQAEFTQGLMNTPSYEDGKDNVAFPASRIHSGMGVVYSPNFYLTPVHPNTPLSVSAEAGLLSNDYALDGAALTLQYDPQTNTPPAHGALAVNSDGSFTYTPEDGYVGSDFFTYTLSGSGATQTSWVFLRVNDPPVIDTTAQYTVGEGEGLWQPLPFTNTDDPAVVFYIKTYPQHGQLDVYYYNLNFGYLPGTHYNGPDQFTAVVVDLAGNRVEFTVNITVTPFDDAPEAAADGFYTVTDSEQPQGPQYQWDEIDASGTELHIPEGDDSMDDDYFASPLDIGFDFPFMSQTFNQLWVSSNGYVTLGGNAGSGTIPNQNPTEDEIGNAIFFLGGDRFIDGATTHVYYQHLNSPERFVLELVDLHNCCSTDENHTVEMILYPDGRIINQYKSLNISADNDEGNPVGIENDTDYWLSYPILSLKDGLAVEYRQDHLYVENGAARTFTFAELMGNDLEYDGDVMEFFSADALAGETHGTLLVDQEAGTVTYTPAEGFKGYDTFSYTIQDKTTAQKQSTAVVRVLVNDRPVADALDPLTVDQGASVDGQLTGSDAENDPFHFVIKTEPAHGILALNDDGSFTYTPDKRYSGSDSFTYVVVDVWGRESTPVTVAITIKQTLWNAFLPVIGH